MVQYFLEKINGILNYQYWSHLPLGRGVALHLFKLQSPSPKDALCYVLLKLNLSVQYFIVLEKKMEMGKVWAYNDVDNRANNGEILIRKARFQEPSVQ